MRNISMHASRALFRIAVLALCALPMHGQTADTGAIAGAVSDPSGALVPHAAVVINSQGTGEKRDLATDAEGSFSAQFLPPGNYNLTVSAAGFEPFVLKDVQVQITEVSKVKIPLALRGAKEQIAVSAALPLLQTENATLGRVIDRNTIEELPLVNRNFTEILGLTAGTNTDIVDATQLGAGSQEIRANGARSGDNNFMLNGVDANSYSSNITEVTPFGGAGIAIPAPDAIQEFKVQTSLYDAQFGRGAGANVNIETRSGTADLHGNAYYFGRNEALDANNFFANETGVPRGEFRRSQPGGTLGGPAPRSKKRAFFFVSYQATRDVNAASLSSSVSSLSLPPIPQVRTPASLGAVFGGQTGVFGGVAVARDGSNINPVALNLLNAKNPDGTYVIPSPQTSGSGVDYTAVAPGKYNEDQFNTNFDFNLRTADRLSAKFFFSNSNQDVPFFGATVPGFPGLRSFRNRNLAIAETHIFSARAINQFRFGFSRVAGQGAAGGTLTDQDMGISRFSDPQEGIIPQIDVLGAFQLGDSASDKGRTAGNNFYTSDAIFLSRGKHNLRLGTEIYRNQLNYRGDFSAGSLTVLSFPDFLLGLPAGAGGNGTSFSNVYGSGVTAGLPNGGKRATAVDVFAVDDWKVTGTLTMNLGVRVEVNGQPSEVQGRESNFFPQFYVAPHPAALPARTRPDLFCPATISATPRRDFLVEIQRCWIILYKRIRNPGSGSLGSHFLQRTSLFEEDMASTRTASASWGMGWQRFRTSRSRWVLHYMAARTPRPAFRIRFQNCRRILHSRISSPICCPVHRLPGTDSSPPPTLPTLILRNQPSSSLTSICSIGTRPGFSQSRMPVRRARTCLSAGATIRPPLPVPLTL